MKPQSIRNEIAEIEWRRVTSIAWPALSVILVIQVFLAESSIEKWQILFIAGLIFSLAISWFLGKYELLRLNFTPVALYMMVTPIIIGDRADHSWMSLGIVTFAAAIYFGSIRNFLFAFVSVTITSLFQSYISFQDLASLTDNSDLSYFHSYFSFIWIFIMGLATIFIRRRYLEVADSIQELVETEMERSVSELAKMKQVNQKDSRNLTLHGTILNTLIYLRNQLQLGQGAIETVSNLKREVAELLEISNVKISENLSDSIKRVIDFRSRKRVQVSFATGLKSLASPQLTESCIEIIRELILNCEKHTEATSASIRISRRGNESIEIVFVDNSLQGIPKSQRSRELYAIKGSRSLSTLLAEVGATLKVRKFSGGRLKKTTISIPDFDVQSELKVSLTQARFTGLNDFILNYMRAGALVALLSLAGYIAVGMPSFPLLVTALTTILLFSSLRFPRSRTLLYLQIFASTLIIPSLSFNVQSCTDLNTIPWIFNLIVVVSFFAVVSIKNSIFKWIPTAILTAETLYFPIFYPNQCKNIFLGSLPGIPIIIVLAISVLAVRRREVRFDEFESLEAARLSQVITDIDTYREFEFAQVLRNVKKFTDSIVTENLEMSAVQILNLEIQKIQTFLVCAEYFDSNLVRNFYEFMRDRQSRGIAGRISILGENINDLDAKIDESKLVEQLTVVLADSPASLTLVKENILEVHIEELDRSRRIKTIAFDLENVRIKVESNF